MHAHIFAIIVISQTSSYYVHSHQQSSIIVVQQQQHLQSRAISVWPPSPPNVVYYCAARSRNCVCVYVYLPRPNKQISHGHDRRTKHPTCVIIIHHHHCNNQSQGTKQTPNHTQQRYNERRAATPTPHNTVTPAGCRRQSCHAQQIDRRVANHYPCWCVGQKRSDFVLVLSDTNCAYHSLLIGYIYIYTHDGD